MLQIWHEMVMLIEFLMTRSLSSARYAANQHRAKNQIWTAVIVASKQQYAQTAKH
jgi:hypothetical protein